MEVLPHLGGNSCAFPKMGNTISLMKYSVIVRAKRILQRVSEGLNPLFSVQLYASVMGWRSGGS